MSIRPPSDIVLDVVRAADPERLAAATSRLQTFAAQKGDAPAFAEAVDGVSARRVARSGPLDPATTLARLSDAGASRRAEEKAPINAPFRQFEAVVLRSFVESMMPTKSEVAFGKGTAGQVWKGLLADEIGAAMARAGGIGIAKQVAAVHGPKGPKAGTPGDQALFESLWQTRVASPRLT
ncbi:rod-binding protein [Salinarimonas soli]|uniref:Flagellar protein FlgJ N-terminal domain-containing protein n=1 Tax=Salinarimonas soli TaxID=1638099 RepID=A0A5B2V8R4_9HYPH|nr:rod-binding protein [Salinarimonas soli]KAA2234719.1 hypothetical protein F0L46_23430 [Salinarimonas soli]